MKKLRLCENQMSDFALAQLAALNPMARESLIADFEASCRENHSKPAFHCLGKTISFAELERLSANFAAYLLGEGGLQPGDRMAIQLPNCLQYPIVAWGALRAGVVIVNTNPMYTKHELTHQLNDSGAKAMVVLADLLGLHADVISESEVDLLIATHVLDLHDDMPVWEAQTASAKKLNDVLEVAEQCAPVQVEVTMASPALLQYTGGTTGRAKGAVLCHGNLFAAVKQSEGNSLEGSNDLIIAPLPIYHIFGFAVYMLAGVLQGGQSVLIPDPRNTDYLVDIMANNPFTGFAAVNTMFIALMSHPKFDEIDFSHLKTVIAGGAALVPEVAREWKRRTGSDIDEGYGLSETASVLCCNGTNGQRMGTVGRPLMAQEICVIDEAGKRLQEGEAGELCVRGPQVMCGYWNQPEASKDVLDGEGWFRTGDVAVVDADGFVRIVDRIKDMILVSGFNVYPNEVEAVLYDHPDVIECAVIGVQESLSGEAVKAVIVRSNPELTSSDLIMHCRNFLTAYKVPKFVEFRDELPKSNVGKILRRELR